MPGVLFTILHRIGQLHKGLGSKRCHFGLFYYFRLGPCIDSLMKGPETSVGGNIPEPIISNILVFMHFR